MLALCFIYSSNNPLVSGPPLVSRGPPGKTFLYRLYALKSIGHSPFHYIHLSIRTYVAGQGDIWYVGYIQESFRRPRGHL